MPRSVVIPLLSVHWAAYGLLRTDGPDQFENQANGSFNTEGVPAAPDALKRVRRVPLVRRC